MLHNMEPHKLYSRPNNTMKKLKQKRDEMKEQTWITGIEEREQNVSPQTWEEETTDRIQGRWEDIRNFSL